MGYITQDAPKDGNIYVRRNGKWVKIITTDALSLLHYDTDAILDEAGKLTWTLKQGTATINKTNAKFGNNLVLDGSTYLTSSYFTLGGQDFTIEFWGSMTVASQTNPSWIIVAGPSYNAATGSFSNPSKSGFPYTEAYINFLTFNNRTRFWVKSHDMESILDTYARNTSVWISLNTPTHFAAVYKHSIKTVYYFVNGKLIDTMVLDNPIEAQTVFVVIGHGARYTNLASPGYSLLKGTIDEFCIMNGKARWTNNFTPPEAPYAS